jgi:predicted 2-oxoglutarate/Fe(II)-dependent dioxygenase YbiX
MSCEAVSTEEARALFVRDRARKEQVHVLPGVLSPEQCRSLRHAAEAAAAAQGGWCSSRHAAFPTRDLPLSSLPERARSLYSGLVHDRVLSQAAALAGFAGPHQLFCRDLFVVTYDCSPGGQRGLPPHMDGSLLSFSVLLSHEHEFTGGGTVFPHLDGHRVALRQGDACLHSGSVMHAGAPVTAGTRVILVGFIDTKR